MGSRQEDQSLESHQSWPRGGWCPKRLADISRGCLLSQGVGWLGQEHSAEHEGHASSYLEHFNLLQHELLCLHVIPGKHNDLLHSAPICKTPQCPGAQCYSWAPMPSLSVTGGPCWSCGKEGSPRPIPISLLLWQVAMSGVECASSGNHLCLECATRVSESAQRSMGTCTRAGEGQD